MDLVLNEIREIQKFDKANAKRFNFGQINSEYKNISKKKYTFVCKLLKKHNHYSNFFLKIHINKLTTYTIFVCNPKYFWRKLKNGGHNNPPIWDLRATIIKAVVKDKS